MSSGAAQRITVRFEEFERYDPMDDQQKVRFMCITSFGTYHAELPMYGAKSLRKMRESFKQRALDAIRSGVGPHEMSMTEH